MADAALLELDGISKHYGGLQALSEISFSAEAGQVLALLGDNGAGKSTLLKVLSGAERADSGSVRIRGHEAQIRSPRDAEALGVEMVYQDLALVGTLDAGSNLYLGREPTRSGILGFLGILDRPRMRAQTLDQLGELGVTRISMRSRVTMLSGGQRQAIAIARATGRGGESEKILLLDEPTAALGIRQQRRVLDLIKRLRDRGMLVVLISHDLPSCFEVCDRLVILRQGKMVVEVAAAETSMPEVVGWITGAAGGEEAESLSASGESAGGRP